MRVIRSNVPFDFLTASSVSWRFAHTPVRVQCLGSAGHMDAARGRECAGLQGDELAGMISFNDGDDSGFVARRARKRSGTQIRHKYDRK